MALIYAGWDFIEVINDVPLLQIDATYYGRPILEGSSDPKLPFEDAAIFVIYQ